MLLSRAAAALKAKILRWRTISPSRTVSALPVSYRIAAIAALPAIGFLAIGIAFTSGETDVENAFAGTKEAALLAGASREFRSGLNAMKFSAKDFATSPRTNLITAFNDGHAETTRSLDVIQKSLDPAIGNIGKLVPHIRSVAEEIKSDFDELIKARKSLGYEEGEGIEGRLRQSAAALKKLINEQTWLTESDAHKIKAAQ